MSNKKEIKPRLIFICFFTHIKFLSTRYRIILKDIDAYDKNKKMDITIRDGLKYSLTTTFTTIIENNNVNEFFFYLQY